MIASATRIPIDVKVSLVDLMQLMFFKGGLILLATAIVVFALRRSAAASRHWVWLAALSSLVVLPFLPSLLPAFEIPVIPIWNSGLIDTNTLLFDSISTMRVVEILSFGWFVVALLLLNRIVGSHRNAKQLFEYSERLDDDEWHDLLENKCRELEIQSLVRLRVNSRTPVPLTMGVRSFAIILPSTCNEWTDEQKSAVLLHELSHIKRRDCLLQLIADVAVALHWFNPLVWYAAARARYERERAADDMVLATGVMPSVYATTLLDLVRDTRKRPMAALAFSKRNDLEQRMKAILDPSLEFRSANRTSTIFAVAIVVGITLPFASLQPMKSHQSPTFASAVQTHVHEAPAESGGVIIIQSPRRSFELRLDVESRARDEAVIQQRAEIAEARELNKRLQEASDRRRASEILVERERQRAMEVELGATEENVETLVRNLQRAVDQVDRSLDGSFWTSSPESYESYQWVTGKSSAVSRAINNRHQIDWDKLERRGVDREFALRVIEFNPRNVSSNDIIRLHSTCNDVDFVDKVLDTFPRAELSHVARLADYDVGKKWLGRIASLFGPSISGDELVRLARFEIDDDIIERVDEMGFDDVSVDHLVSVVIAGLDAGDLCDYSQAGLTEFSLEDIARMARHGIFANDIVWIRDSGLATGGVDEIIQAYYVSDSEEPVIGR